MGEGKHEPGRKLTPPETARFRILGGRTLAEYIRIRERTLIVEVLVALGQSRTKTAEALGLSREGLWQKMRRHGLSEDHRTVVRRMAIQYRKDQLKS
jgi:DNA-binding NtrC family response regulator